ncbi:hypothetical protein F5148DRAFT_1290902 [Russula earlei]|uniref:Uncharacterized protein n=1 Tax=Russula earlei TaxID=71964 RepID=A0ACC0TV14_9AGAM|nr:hypothetical protein F5148DRAFT_1290902 [Russula earlei]
MFDPATAEYFELQMDLASFHNNYLVYERETTLSEDLFSNVLQSLSLEGINYNSCIGHKLPLFLGGKDAIENYEVWDIELYSFSNTYDFNSIEDINNLIEQEYGKIVEGLCVFGQDVFGNQFGFDLRKNEVILFNIETGDSKSIAKSFDGFLSILLEDLEYYTGSAFVNKYFKSLKFNERLCPKIPFVIGGEYAEENLYISPYPKYMKANANIALQIYGLPNGTQIKINRVKEKGTAGDTLSTTTDYLGGYVYTNNVLQFFGHEAGRIRKSKDTTQGFVYDYFLKDHLGNTRAVLTEEQTMDIYPAATLEDGSLAVDTFYYNIQSGNIRDISLIPGYSTASGVPYTNNNGIYNPDPGITTTNESQKMYVLNGQSGSSNGLGIAVRVMAGDTVNIFGKSYYHLNSGQTPNNGYPVTNALLSFLNAFTGTGAVTAGSHAVTGSTLNSSPLTTDGLTAWLNDSIPTVTGKPKAYINWILFDDQFTPVSSGSGFSAVNSNPDIINTHTATTNITKNGYLYVYCSNESDVDVFFDNLQVVHSRGPLTEETHYYPWGLTMAGISSKAAGGLENKYKFNKGTELQHHEFSDGSGLELYATNYRSLDPQLGRFWQIDPLADIFTEYSPYTFVSDNPISMTDMLGLEGDTMIAPKPLPRVSVSSSPKNNNSTPVHLPLYQIRISSDNARIAPVSNPGALNVRYIPGSVANMGYSQPAFPATSMVREDEEIQQNLALPETPDQIVEVDVPEGTVMRAGPVGANDFGPGNPNITQYKVMEELPNSAFSAPTPLKVPTPGVMPEGPTLEEPLKMPETTIPEFDLP